jgi:hypothetical protein
MSLSFAEPRGADPKRIAQPGCKAKTKPIGRAKLARRLETAAAAGPRADAAVTRLVQSVP